ncbi:acetyltransferase [Metabacillus sediminilitoris]|uniref:Acetyltransferase n=1 Tax=Metabacillus sediminilitoris TaxID=2567941 RepID=A0A4S4BZ52_9BACI|nr:acetyltransferase [Metabacillus sediminilitoris]QGQ47223.1 acetyltransferase [Metabacillus sediminilitoris]THF80567.1 acetyltransferase [Metabacillus sediminilitoris]
MNIVIIGQGGHSKVIKDLIRNYESYKIIALLDDKFEDFVSEDEVFYGPIASYQFLINQYKDIKFIVAIGNNKTRKKIVETLNLEVYNYTTIIHPSAIVSPSVKIGKGTVIMSNTVINADVEIGNHVIINTGSIIEHDNKVSDFVHVSPNATLTGNVHVGEGVHIGAGATIIPNVFVGDWSVIGAGATVIDSIPENITAMGVPARIKKLVGGA